jgi:SAM-dependent methyltransferase
MRPSWVSSEVDLTRPSVARVYDYYLGGSHNLEVDRRMARQAIAVWPNLRSIMQSNRAFLRRVVRYAAAKGITQFLDIGSGIPTVGNVHEVAQQKDPQARVVYVDNDPVAVSHSRAILAGNERTAVVQADLREPDSLLEHPVLSDMIDLERPVAVIMAAVLHFVPDEDDPLAVVDRVRKRLAPGSYLVVTHASAEGRSEESGPLGELYRRTATPINLRSRNEIMRFFDGLELVDPGLVWLPQWRPDDDSDVDKSPELMGGFAGVGRKR